jgi:transposase
MWCIPPKQNAAFVAQMEQVLDVYQRPYDPRFPVICMDESNKQLVDNIQSPLPVKPGQAAKVDCNYERHGTCNLFLAFEPMRGYREVTVTARRTHRDWATYIKKIVNELYPTAERITLVCDQLNTHTLAALYETFPPEEAHRLARKLALVYTPKHGSWLNMAEIELSALSRQCLNRRMTDAATMTQEVSAWAQARNAHSTTVHWRFTTTDARVKLASLYPKLLL